MPIHPLPCRNQADINLLWDAIRYSILLNMLRAPSDLDGALFVLWLGVSSKTLLFCF